ncbi:MAG: hypothetical protein EAZ84_05950 [Verrucomicrobia bacterium]|nr:MAG: hypothetical protein EAZ84_05950 [Verrucomicrobiota bacterium]
MNFSGPVSETQENPEPVLRSQPSELSSFGSLPKSKNKQRPAKNEFDFDDIIQSMEADLGPDFRLPPQTFENQQTRSKKEPDVLRVEPSEHRATARQDGTIDHKKTPKGGEKTRKTVSDPWRINRFMDLWSFFGPMLTCLFATQLYTGFMLSRFLKKRRLLPENLDLYQTTPTIGVLLAFTSCLALRTFRGRHYENFAPILIILIAISAISAFLLYLALDVI